MTVIETSIRYHCPHCKSSYYKKSEALDCSKKGPVGGFFLWQHNLYCVAGDRKSRSIRPWRLFQGYRKGTWPWYYPEYIGTPKCSYTTPADQKWIDNLIKKKQRELKYLEDVRSLIKKGEE